MRPEVLSPSSDNCGHTSFTLVATARLRVVRDNMTHDIIDAIWSAMQANELYSPNDLANILGQSSYIVLRVLDFLDKYGFAERLTKQEPIFMRLENNLGPSDALKVLRMLRGEAEADFLSGIANVSEARRWFRPVQ